MKVLSNFPNSRKTRGALAGKQDFIRWSRNIETPWLIRKVMATLLGDVL